MEVEYELDESDLIALARFQVSHSAVPRQRYLIRRFGYLIGFSLLSLGSYFALNNPLLSIVFGVLAVFIFAFYPSYFRWALEKNIRRVVQQRATSGTFSRQVLRITPDSLDQVNANSESKVKWNLVDDIVVTPTHAFISLDGTFSVVIPKARLGEELFAAFLDALHQYRDSALTDTTISASGLTP
jgi:hypothetical protein